MSTRLFNDADRRLIAELYNDHSIPLAEISARTGASTSTIRVVRREMGCKSRPAGGPRRGCWLPPALRKRIAELYADPKIPIGEIEARTGVCHNTVTRCADEFGKPRRHRALDCCEAASLRPKFKRVTDIAYVLERSRQAVSVALQRHDRLLRRGITDHTHRQPRGS